MNINDIDTSDSPDSPAQYITKLESDVRTLRRQVIKLNKDLDDAGLAVATLVQQRKQLLDEYAQYRAKVKDTLMSLNEKTTLIDIAIENSII